MARIPYADSGTALSSEVRRAIDRWPVPLNIFRMLAHSPVVANAVGDLAQALLGEQSLSPRVREVVILHGAHRRGAAYQWTQHVPIALATGLTDADIHNLRQGKASEPAAAVALELVDALLATGTCSAVLLARLREHFCSREIVELLVTQGFFQLMSQVMNALDVDIDPSGEALVANAPHWASRPSPARPEREG